jgi:hypothetical protein
MARALLKTPTVPQIRESGLGDVRLSLHGQSHQAPSGDSGPQLPGRGA